MMIYIKYFSAKFIFRRKRRRLLPTCLTSLPWLTRRRRPWRNRCVSYDQMIVAKTQLFQSKPDAMNHIDQWSSGGEGNINTDPNSIKVYNVRKKKYVATSFTGWWRYTDEPGHQ